MALTVTRLDEFHRGGATAQTHTLGPVDITEGARYFLFFHGLRNGSGGWTPSVDAVVSDDGGDLTWDYLAASADPSFTGGGTNGSSMVGFESTAATADDTGISVTIDAASTGTVAATNTAFLYAVALYEVVTDTENEITTVQTAGTAQNDDGAIDIDWTTAPDSGSTIIAAWGAIHNSTATPGTEPTGFTADWTNAASVPGTEIQVGSSTADPLSFTFAVSGTTFDNHGFAIELTDAAGGTEATPSAATATGTSAAATAVQPLPSAGTAAATADATTATSATAATAAGAGAAVDPVPAVGAVPSTAAGTGQADTGPVSADIATTAATAVGAADAGPTAVGARPSAAGAVGAADGSASTGTVATPTAATATGQASATTAVEALPAAGTSAGAADGSAATGTIATPSAATAVGTASASTATATPPTAATGAATAAASTAVEASPAVAAAVGQATIDPFTEPVTATPAPATATGTAGTATVETRTVGAPAVPLGAIIATLRRERFHNTLAAERDRRTRCPACGSRIDNGRCVFCRYVPTGTLPAHLRR